MAAEPRMGMLGLARKVGVARNTAQARLDRMIAAGVITGFGPEIDLRAIGFGVLAFLSIDIAQGRGADVIGHLEGLPEVIEVAMIAGQSDLICRVAARDNDHLGKIVEHILEVQGITRTTTALVLSTRIESRILQLAVNPPER